MKDLIDPRHGTTDEQAGMTYLDPRSSLLDLD